MGSLVDYSVVDGIALVRLNRPPMNALSGELASQLGAAFAQAGDPAIRALIVTGHPHFAAGADIKEFQAAYESDRQGEPARSLIEAISALEALDKPTIAAIHGFALGGGLELSMGADFRFLADDARVGQPEIKLGLIPGAGGTQRLPRLVGFQKAKDMVYTGRQVTAAEALQIGLADRVFPSDVLMDEAMKAAAEMATWPTAAIAAAKRSLAEGWGQPLEAGLSVEAREFAVAFASEDAREGVGAFVAKRPPSFRGR
jgi:enoyl-CoA hydratase/carnithine racemase